MRYWK